MKLAKLGVNVIAKKIWNNVVGKYEYIPAICGFVKCNKKDNDCACEAVRFARRPRIHVFIAMIEIQMKYQLMKSKEEIVERTSSMFDLIHWCFTCFIFLVDHYKR